MTEKEIYDLLKEKFPEALLEFNEEALQPFAVIQPQSAAKIAQFLRDDSRLEMDSLMNLSGVDLLTEEENRLQVVYHLFSYKLKHKFVIKANLEREKAEIPSVAMIWRTADWHERETYDLFGIQFTEHPDLRRILLPEDWEGYPLRKDYQTPDYYNGIPVPYPSEDGDLNDE